MTNFVEICKNHPDENLKKMKALKGDTYSIKEEIKKHGGVWNKLWWSVPAENWKKIQVLIYQNELKPYEIRLEEEKNGKNRIEIIRGIQSSIDIIMTKIEDAEMIDQRMKIK